MQKLFLIFALFTLLNSNAQNVGIGTTTPVTSAKLDVTSTNSGLLPPRMTFAQRNAIVNPVAGLIIYCTDCDEIDVYNGNTWKNLTGMAACTSPILPNVMICNQIWATNNLNVSTYRNGDSIPNVTDSATWVNLTTGAYCYFNNDSATYASVYGKLYNWYAVNDSRGLAPTGWHIPSESDWNNLLKCIDPTADTVCVYCIQSITAGGAIKEIGTTHWLSPNTGASNSSGFTALPGGYRFRDAKFKALGIVGYWWSSTAISIPGAFGHYLDRSTSNINSYNDNKTDGFSVRVVRD